MSLTQAEFLQVVDGTSPNQVNIWYSDVEPLTVFGLTVPIVDNTGLNTIQLLQSVQQLNITINSQNYTFNVLSRAERTAAGITYYFFDVEDLQISSLSDDTSILPDQVIYVIPGFQDTNFFGGDYDTLLNNIQQSRESTNIMISDRYKVTGGTGSLNPINIDAIRNQTADRADVQDSNYSSTGWINGRYEGTSTDSTTYGGINSAITGKTFQASYFPTSVSTGSINRQLSGSIVIFSEYLSSGQEDIPTYPTLVDVRYSTVASSIPPTETQIQIKLEPNVSWADLSIGDIIVIDEFGPSREYMRVDNIQPVNSDLMLTVTRRWNNTPTGNYNDDSLIIKKIQGPTKVYQLQGNKVQGVQRGRLVVKDSQEILSIDRLGQVIG